MISRHRPSRLGGFTVVELVITMVLIGILSAVVANRISAKGQHSVTVQADLLRRNLSHLQLLAISESVRLNLTVVSGGYTVSSCSASGCTGTVTDPATGAAFSVNVTTNDDGSASGVTFTGGIGSYYFDSLGRPVVAATGGNLATLSSVFTLSGSGNCVQVTVLPITGFATAASPYRC